MKNFIKHTIDRIRRKPLLVKPVVSGSFRIIERNGQTDELFIHTGEYELFETAMKMYEVAESALRIEGNPHKDWRLCITDSGKLIYMNGKYYDGKRIF